MQPHILFILDHFSPFIGGAEILFDNLTQRLVKEGYTVTILTTHHDPKLSKHEIFADGREVYRSARNRYIFVLQSIYLAIRLAKRADIIHTTTYSGAIPARIAGWIARKPVVITVHEVFFELWYRFMGWKGFFYKMFERIVLSLPFAANICVSEYTRNSLRLIYNIPDEKLHTVYNGIDTALFDRKKIPEKSIHALRDTYHLHEKKSVLFYGRPGVSKGLEYLVAAIPNVVASVPDIEFLLIIGNEPRDRKKIIIETLEKFHLDNNITIIAPQKPEDLRVFVSAVDLCVVPSLAEGFGFAAAEICALETPLLATNAGALSEVVSGICRVVDSGNTDAIAIAIREFFATGYQKLPKKIFTWEENLQKTTEIYAKLR